jgi:hypothetical protein|tara:strand:+ start:937 stop:2058 length:1122 start_codon:yes stop_codon:yes gene_type:complete
MSLIDKVLLEWSYRTEKGYPDINSVKDIALFESIFGFNLINEAKHPFEYLSKEAQALGKELILKLNLDDDEIIAHAKNRIIVYTDKKRSDIFVALQNLGYEKDQITGSSGGGFRTPEGIEIIHKNQTSVGDAGLDNEAIVIAKINELISVHGGPINVVIKPSQGNIVFNYPNVESAVSVGRETGDNKKADIRLYNSSGEIPISIKKDGPFRWSSAMTTHRDVFDSVLAPGMGDGTEDLKLVQDLDNPKLLNMINPKNNKPYGSIFVLNAPGMGYDALAFGSDKAVVVKRTFSELDFNFSNDTLTITSSRNYEKDEDFDKEDKPIIRFERNASKASNTEGYAGRGITIRTVPIKGFLSTTSRANTLKIDYKDLK